MTQHFAQHTVPLSISHYVDAAMYTQEQNQLVSGLSQYVGHRLMVPQRGDYHVLAWQNKAKLLIHADDGIHLLSNVCRHRQAIMLDDRGKCEHIVCPIHRWAYDTQGTLLGAPHFEKSAGIDFSRLNLQRTHLTSWQGLLFHGKQDVASHLNQLGCLNYFDFSQYAYHHSVVTDYAFNWKTFIEVYLEDYHITPFHPGLNSVVDCQSLHWELGDNYSVQTVGYKPPNQAATPAYNRWNSMIARYHKREPDFGAIWLVYYPFLMLEWYPQTLVISHIIPRGVHGCTNVVEFYYHQDIALFEPEYIAAQQAAYLETAVEDKEICERTHQGRQALAAQNIHEIGPYQYPMEEGLAHFHHWYRRHVADTH